MGSYPHYVCSKWPAGVVAKKAKEWSAPMSVYNSCVDVATKHSLLIVTLAAVNITLVSVTKLLVSVSS